MMNNNRWSLYWMGVLMLSACNGSTPLSAKFDDSVLRQPKDVAPWVAGVKADAAAQAAEAASEKSSRLMTLEAPTDVVPVFTTAASEVVPKSIVTQRSGSLNNDSALELKNQAARLKTYDDIYSKSNINTQPTMPATTYSPSPLKTIDLAQASATDLYYVGMILQGTQAMGLVKVGTRLYPVRVGDKIGQGAWPVVGLTAHSMQLKIANKAVSYDKN